MILKNGFCVKEFYIQQPVTPPCYSKNLQTIKQQWQTES